MTLALSVMEKEKFILKNILIKIINGTSLRLRLFSFYVVAAFYSLFNPEKTKKMINFYIQKKWDDNIKEAKERLKVKGKDGKY